MKRNWHRPKESNLLLNRCDGSSALNKEHHPSWPNTSEQSAARSYAPYNRPVEVASILRVVGEWYKKLQDPHTYVKPKKEII